MSWNEQLEQLPRPSSEEDLARFRVSMLETRFRELEYLVLALLKPHLQPEAETGMAEAWFKQAGNRSTTMLAAVRGRGERIADIIGREGEDRGWASIPITPSL